jgi:hypothetical protein
MKKTTQEQPITPRVQFAMDARKFWLAQARSLVVRALEILKDQGEDEIMADLLPFVDRIKD